MINPLNQGQINQKLIN